MVINNKLRSHCTIKSIFKHWDTICAYTKIRPFILIHSSSKGISELALGFASSLGGFSQPLLSLLKGASRRRREPSEAAILQTADTAKCDRPEETARILMRASQGRKKPNKRYSEHLSGLYFSQCSQKEKIKGVFEEKHFKASKVKWEICCLCVGGSWSSTCSAFRSHSKPSSVSPSINIKCSFSTINYCFECSKHEPGLQKLGCSTM